VKLGGRARLTNHRLDVGGATSSCGMRLGTGNTNCFLPHCTLLMIDEVGASVFCIGDALIGFTVLRTCTLLGDMSP